MLILLATGLIALNWVNFSVVSKFPSSEYLAIPWIAGRTFLTEGMSPYSTEASALIQSTAVENGYPVDPALHRFIFPIYLHGLMLPILLISKFTTAAVVWMALLEIALILVALFCIRISGWQLNLPMTVLVVVWVLLNFISASQIYQGSVMIVVTLLVVLAFAAIQRDLDELAGITLALATIKPSPIILVLIFALVWGVSNKRWKLIAWTVGVWILFVAGGLFLLNDWPLQYLRLIINSPPSHYFQSPLSVFIDTWPGLGKQLGWVLIGILAILLLFEWWVARKKEFRWFLWTACLTLTITPWIGLPSEPGYQVLLIIPIVLIWAKLEEKWGARARPMVIAMMIFVFAGLWLLFGWDLPSTLVTRLYPILFLPLPLVSLIGLYWVKWWSVRKRKTFISELKAGEEF